MWVRLSLEAQVWLGIPALSLPSWHPKQGCGVRPKTEVSAACCHNSKRTWGVLPHSTLYPPDSVFEARTPTTPQPRTGHGSGSFLQVTELYKHPRAGITQPASPSAADSLCSKSSRGPCEHALPRSLVHVTAASNSSHLTGISCCAGHAHGCGTGLPHQY